MSEARRRSRESSFPIGAAAGLEELELDPHPLLARLREREPVSWLPTLGGWLVTRRDLALRAMRDPASFMVDDPRSSTGQALLSNAVEESLRLEPAAAVIDRYATGDARLGDAAISQGELVTLSIAGANRDPSFFPDPDRYDIRRENVRHQLAFAAGPHVCIGMHLARLEARTAIGRLLDRLPRLQLDPAHPSAPRGLVFRKPPTLHVVWG
jgi:cytochrome P450